MGVAASHAQFSHLKTRFPPVSPQCFRQGALGCWALCSFLSPEVEASSRGVFGFGGIYNQGPLEFSEALSSEPDASVGPCLRPAVPIAGNAQNPWLDWAGQDSLGGQGGGGKGGGGHTLL